MRDRHGYDYNHATSGQQFLAIILIILIVGLGALLAGLTLFTQLI